MPCMQQGNNPVIGLSVNISEENSKLHEAYIRSVIDAGGIPILIPATLDSDVLSGIIENIDGLILTGGADVDGRYFGEETLTELTDVDPFRDAYDFLLLRLADDRQIPVLGICRGAQVINIAFGGTIWQDIDSQYPSEAIEHKILTSREKPVHSIEVEKNSVLYSIFGKTTLSVNSRHHQAIKKSADGFRATAFSSDGIIEAIEGYPCKRIIGVQWHPENMASEDDNEDMKSLFNFFVKEAGLYRKAKEVHDRNLTVDSHCDTPMLFENHTINIGRRDLAAQVDLPKMYEGKLDAVFIAVYLPQGDCSHDSYLEATNKAFALLEETIRQINHNIQYTGLARSFIEADILKKENRKAIFLAVENGYAIGQYLANIEKFKNTGVTYITLCHNGANIICDSASGSPVHGGLSNFGREVVREMNRLGLIIDLSHSAESTFYDVLQASSTPVICSHSSVRSLCDHPRNLTDDQIKLLASKEGVIQICLYSGFLVKDRNATAQDAVDHIEYVIKLVGPDHVGIGSDFDGGGGINGCNGSNEIINITVELLRRGYRETDIAKILGGNLRRVVDKVQRQAELN